MKQLKKIRLINWHMFHDRTIEVDGNILLTGENGTGKSTLLDALQFVLTAGKAKFNIAANENAKRKLEGYIRGKIGIEGQEYLRNGDVTTHIALEFYDDEDNDCFVIGSVIDLPKEQSPRKHFYILYHTSIQDSFYLNEQNQSRQWSNFISTIKIKVKKYEALEHMNEVSRKFLHVLGLKKKYHDLLPKALAFKPIDALNKFIFDFLLNENPINLDSLKDNIRRYREFQHIIEDQKKRLAILDTLYHQNEEYESKKLELRKFEYLTDIINFDQREKDYEEQDKLKQELTSQSDTLEKKMVFDKACYDRLNQEFTQIAASLQNNDSYRYKRELQRRQEELKSQFSQAKTSFQQFHRDIQKEVSLLNQLHYAHTLIDQQEAILQDEQLYNKLSELHEFLGKERDDLHKKAIQIGLSIRSELALMDTIQNELKTLENKKFTYRTEVRELLDLLKRELTKIANSDVDIRPLCEYLEVNDEVWRDAVEGFLNTQRFDILVEPRYFSYAVELYEQYKEKHGIHGIGIVDVAKLKDYEEVKEGTLAEKVDTKNPYARNYVNMLMNRVFLEEDVKKLRNHNIAITPTCMVYRNYTVRAIHPRVYKVPFIGQKALHVQLDIKRKELQEVSESLRQYKQSQSEFQMKLDILKQSKLPYLVESCVPIVQKYNDISSQLKDIEENLKQIKKDESWLTLEEQAKQKKLQMTEAYNHAQASRSAYDACVSKMNELEQNLLSMKDDILQIKELKLQRELENVDILQSLDMMYMELKKVSKHDFMNMRRINDKRIKNAYEKSVDIERAMKETMHEFNRYTNIGYAETLDDLERYFKIYHHIRDIELDDALQKSQIACKKCEDSFQEDFISTLKVKFDDAKRNIKSLNETLKKRTFNGERYEFIIKPSLNPKFSQYYDIIMSGEKFSKDSLFVDELSASNRGVMMELFDFISAVDNDNKNEKLLHEYTDYRQYMSYDIKIYHSNGQFSYFSKVSAEKSGGETQTPYYVTIAASFEQLLYLSNARTTPGCLVLFDEAFNNMDESRIEAMMQFYKDLNIQMIIAVPPGRIQTITPYVDTVLTLIKHENQVFVGSFENDQ